MNRKRKISLISEDADDDAQIPSRKIRSEKSKDQPEDTLLTSKKDISQSCRPNKPSPASVLTDELLLNIFSWLSFKSIKNCLLVSKRWNRVANDNKIWRDLYTSEFSRKTIFRSNLTLANQSISSNISFDWKKIFKIKYNWKHGSSHIKYLKLSQISERDQNALHESILSSELSDNTSDSDDGSDEESEEGQQTNIIKQIYPSSLDLLVAARNQLIATIGSDCKLVVKNCEETMSLDVNIKDYIQPAFSELIGTPSTLVISQLGSFRISVGFTTGSFAIFSLEGIKPGDRDKGEPVRLEMKHIAVIDHTQYGAIRNIVHRQNIIAVYTDRSNILLYSIADGDTKTVSVLKSYIDPTQAVSFSIRSFHYQRLLFCISVAYCRRALNGDWIPYIQEIICAPDGSIVNTRMSTCSSATNVFSTPIVHGVLPPTSISYNHPYLLAGFEDNTLSYYHVRSAECCLEIQPKKRLWGHMKGIKHVSVKPGGVAVSVSSGFPEIRWWQLEDNDDSTLIYIPHDNLNPQQSKNQAELEELQKDLKSDYQEDDESRVELESDKSQGANDRLDQPRTRNEIIDALKKDSSILAKEQQKKEKERRKNQPVAHILPPLCQTRNIPQDPPHADQNLLQEIRKRNKQNETTYFSDNKQTGGFLTFDDEMIILEVLQKQDTSLNSTDRCLLVCDFR